MYLSYALHGFEGIDNIISCFFILQTRILQFKQNMLFSQCYRVTRVSKISSDHVHVFVHTNPFDEFQTRKNLIFTEKKKSSNAVGAAVEGRRQCWHTSWTSQFVLIFYSKIIK